MLGLGSSIVSKPVIGKSIIRDGLVLKHDYNAGAVEPCSTGAVYLNGAGDDDYIDIGNQANLNMSTGSFSVSCWVYSNHHSTPTTRFVLGKGDNASTASSTGYALYLGNSGTDWIFSVGDGTDYKASKTTVEVNYNQWYHVCGTFDGTAKTLKLYVDGALIDTDTDTDIGGIDNTTAFQIGRIAASTSKTWDGYICNVGVWKGVALTQPQIKSIMHKDYAALSASEKEDLVSWWNLDSVIDSVGAPTAVYDNHYAGGSELGAEMINNGSFDENDTGWDIDSGGAGTTKTWVNSFGGREGVLHVSVQGTDSTNNRLKQSIDYVSGAWYKVQADIYVVSGVVRIDGKDEDMLGGTGGDVITTSGTGSWVTYTAYGYTPTANSSNTDSLFIRALASSTAEFYIDNISVKQVNGNTGTLS